MPPTDCKRQAQGRALAPNRHCMDKENPSASADAPSLLQPRLALRVPAPDGSQAPAPPRSRPVPGPVENHPRRRHARHRSSSAAATASCSISRSKLANAARRTPSCRANSSAASTCAGQHDRRHIRLPARRRFPNPKMRFIETVDGVDIEAPPQALEFTNAHDHLARTSMLKPGAEGRPHHDPRRRPLLPHRQGHARPHRRPAPHRQDHLCSATWPSASSRTIPSVTS